MWQYSESYHHREPEPAPEQVKAPVSRRRVIDLDGLSDVWWRPRPAVAQRVAVAEPALSEAAERERAVGRRVRRIEGLIDRVGRLDVVRGDADLVEELDNLDVTDPAACLHTVDIVLAEALGRERAQTDPDLLDPWIRRLELSVAEAETIRHELVVAPAADGRIDGRVPKKKGAVEVRDSVAVMRGDHNRLEVSHLCVVEQPVIEIADLVALDGEQAVFDLWAWGSRLHRAVARLRCACGWAVAVAADISRRSRLARA